MCACVCVCVLRALVLFNDVISRALGRRKKCFYPYTRSFFLCASDEQMDSGAKEEEAKKSVRKEIEIPLET